LACGPASRRRRLDGQSAPEEIDTTPCSLNPVRANSSWNDVVSLFEFLGATVKGAGGSISVVDLGGVKLVRHRPHPGKELSKGRVREIRTYLEALGVDPDDL